MSATFFASFVCAVLAMLCWAIGEAAGRPRGWRIAGAIFAVVAVSIGWLP